jgi:hypothetical protein
MLDLKRLSSFLCEPMKLHISNFGPIERADIDFGDLTVLVGPQATGKSVTLQLFKLLLDRGHIMAELQKHGLYWDKRVDRFLRIYLGEGMDSALRSDSTIGLNGKAVDLVGHIERMPKTKTERVFFIPAQRVLSLRDGWPRPFTDYRPGDPFVVRQFSERLRLLMESEFSDSPDLFPAFKRLNKDVKGIVDQAIFRGFTLRVDASHSQKRLILSDPTDRKGDHPIPAMVWSAGQREFVPLLAGLYWAMPGSATPRREPIEWVIVEEPETGLHPQAISAVMLMVLELMSRGYKVCLSTHSPHVLDVIFALKRLHGRQDASIFIRKLFSEKKSDKIEKIARDMNGKLIRVYGFDAQTKVTTDISNLDPLSELEIESGWGGLTGFSGKVGDVLAEAARTGGAS